MVGMFVEEMKVSKTNFHSELSKYETTKGLISNVGISEILAEETSLIRSIETFEERALRSGKLKGISMGFPILDEALDGLQPGLILVAGKWNTGKSGWIQSMLLNILRDPTNYGLFFSIDDSAIHKTVPRLIANLSMVPINTVSNPINRIDKNETLDEAEKLLLKQKREEAIVLLKKYSGRLGLKDSSDGYDTPFIEKMIKIYKSIAGERNLVIFVDFLNMVKFPKVSDRTEQETQLAGFFKHMSGLYNVPIVCTVEATKDVAINMKEADIKGSSSLQFRSDLTILLSSDFEADPKSTMYFYGDNGEANPVVQLRVSKNKMSGFRRSIYYKFYRNYSKFEECSEIEQQEYGRKGG
jgi:replicative DNA helicase